MGVPLPSIAYEICQEKLMNIGIISLHKSDTAKKNSITSALTGGNAVRHAKKLMLTW